MPSADTNFPLPTPFFNFCYFPFFYDNSPKHLFFHFLCKSTIPHPVHVDNVDKFVYNSIFKAFPVLKKVENYCIDFCTINIFRHPLCKVLNPQKQGYLTYFLIIEKEAYLTIRFLIKSSYSAM